MLASVAMPAMIISSGGPSPDAKALTSSAALPADYVLPAIGDAYRIEITMSENRWLVRYPDTQPAESGGLAVQDIHVPSETNIVFVLKSTDYAYTLALPEYGAKEIAVPDLTFQMEFSSGAPGRFELVGDQWCGDPHTDLPGQLVVETPEQFLEWLKESSFESAD